MIYFYAWCAIGLVVLAIEHMLSSQKDIDADRDEFDRVMGTIESWPSWARALVAVLSYASTLILWPIIAGHRIGRQFGGKP